MKKNITTILLSIAALAVSISSCEDMMEVDSNHVMFEEEHDLGSVNDTLYSVVGILRKVQDVADRYVVLGEMRGDLVDVTENTEIPLREIAGFEVGEDNPYNNISDYYAIINNCNYFLAKLDTTIKVYERPIMYKDYSVVKAIRAWTYLQLVLNYGEVPYYTEPLLSVDDTKKSFPRLGLTEMTTRLIEDIEPFKDYDLPDYTTIYDIPTRLLFFPIRMILGDLHLWRGQAGDYDKAATYYHELIVRNQYATGVPNVEYSNSTFTRVSDNWSGFFNSVNNDELISLIPMARSSVAGKTTTLRDLYGINSTPQLAPSARWTDISDNQRYTYGTTFTMGDLRGEAILSNYRMNGGTYQYMSKFSNSAIIIYRVGLLYLRLAEAANRAGYPEYAFAILKYGLSNSTLSTYVSPKELEDNKAYMQFPETFLTEGTDRNTLGIHARGSGDAADNREYAIREQATKNDSILFVENLIVDELALELAFEGHRFHDLMRVAKHRGDNGYLATMVAQRKGGFDQGLYDRLMDRERWYLPVGE